MTTRLFVSGALSNDAELTLDGEQARYLGKVLRSRVGDPLVVFNGENGEYAARITDIRKDAVTIRLGEHCDSDVESPLKVHLVQGISRGDRMDFVVQKATELGVKRITPVLTQHGVVKLDGKRAEKRQQHWQQVAASACEQSGRIRPPLVDAPVSLNSWFGVRSTKVGDDSDSTEVILQPDAGTRLADIATPATKLCVLIGPEGGFSEREVEDASISGFAAVSLGPRILRTETAAIAALSIAQATWGDL